MHQIHTISLSLLLSVLVLPALTQVEVDIETGAVFSGYNSVRIPGDSGTLFSLSDDLTADAAFFYRLRLFYNLSSRHHLGALFAPLSIDATGELDRVLIFAGETFPANAPLTATYAFNSYRLTYFYDFLNKEKIDVGIGLTAKIRDARIAVEGNGLKSEKTNVGFVPLIHFRFLWTFSDRLAFLLEGDALAAPQGRAEDVLAALIVQASDRIDVKIGYRMLEGGADNDEVYTFALLHYLALGGRFHF